MKKRPSAVLLFSALTCLMASAAATTAQDASSKSKVSVNKRVTRDKPRLVRRALEAQYARLAAAVRNKDYDAFMALRTSDFSTIALKGGPQSTEQMAARTRLLLQVIQPPIDVRFIIVKLDVKGNEAVATIRQRFSRMQMVAGQLRRLETAVTQDETWVRTPGGWKLKFVGNERDLLKFVDGKPVDPLKPYDPNAPAYKPVANAQTANPQPQRISQDEQDVRKLERAWLDAYEQRDAKAMDAIVADDFVITFPDGSMQTKSQVLDSIKAPPNPASPSLRFYTRDVRARVYGDTVILFGRVVSEYTRDGKTVTEQFRYTDTYVKHQGRWQVVASHLSNAPRPGQQSQAVSSNAGAGRSLHGNRLISLKSPAIKIDVDERLRHIGILNFTLKKVAQVERYIYASADEGGRVQRLLIMQFEAILPGVKGGYSFQVTDATRLGEHDYQTNVGFFNFAQTIAANPGAEAEQTKAFLDQKGLKVDDDYLVARYARIVDTEKRRELIFFYLENLRDLGFTLAELRPGGRRASEAEKAVNDFAVRAKQSFKVVDGKS